MLFSRCQLSGAQMSVEQRVNANPSQRQNRADGDTTHSGISDKDFLRYSRQILLPEVGEIGQQRLAQCHVIIVGIGGLGTLAAQYLAAAGVGQLTLIDADKIELSNLPRQLLFNETDIGRFKAEIAAHKLTQAYPDCRVSAINEAFSPATLVKLVPRSHVNRATKTGVMNRSSCSLLVLDCTDNFESRQRINRTCIELDFPLVISAVAHFSGQLLMVDQRLIPNGGCYQCLYPSDTIVSQRCATVGVLGPMVGIMASMQSLLALRYLLLNDTGLSGPDVTDDVANLVGTLWRIDGKSLACSSAILPRNSECGVCQVQNNWNTHDKNSSK